MGGEKLLVKNREIIISSESPASNLGVWTQIPNPCIPPGLRQGTPGPRCHQLLGQGTPRGIRDASTQHPEARTATLCEPITRRGWLKGGLEAPILPPTSWAVGVQGVAHSMGTVGTAGGSRLGFWLRCCRSRDTFNCCSTEEIICRYECRPRGR